MTIVPESPGTLEIVGAGPAGLAAAIAARARGRDVIVHERRADVGTRFHGDFQGLENWSSDTDVLAEMKRAGIDLDFDHTPVYEIVCFGPNGAHQTLSASDPILYLIRRGREAGTLDHELKTQAMNAGARIQFQSRQRRLPSGNIVAEGPHRADVIAAGYVFKTDMANGCYVAVSDYLAPAGYSYLLIDRGRGTVATCMFDKFHDERQYLDTTVAFFERHVGLRWQSEHRFGGSGNFQYVEQAVNNGRSYVGESAGFQDALFGFGLRYALVSGLLAGSSAGSSPEFDRAWRGRLHELNATSIFNRWLYARLGDRGRKLVLDRIIAGRDPRHLLQRIYAPSRWKTRVAAWLPKRPLILPESSTDCDCTWCRCQRDSHSRTRDIA